MKIESINNSKVKEWSKLKEKKYRDLNNKFIIEGDHLLKSALDKNLVLEIISLDKSYEVSNIPFYEVNESIMKKLSNQVSISNVIAICKKLDNKEINGNVCILDNIQDPGNLGTIIRSACAFNINTIIMSNDTVDLYNDKVIRASEGMIFNLNYTKGDLEEILTILKKDNYTIYGTDVKQGESLNNIIFSDKNAVIIGNEGKGMNNNLYNLCDKFINIPINSNCESLNAGVAASIIFYEMER